jgi:hypothetical protein
VNQAHFEGVARSETLETCWMLRADCHRAKHRDGDPQSWRRKFVEHCERHSYSRVTTKIWAAIEAEELVNRAASMTRGARDDAR